MTDPPTQAVEARIAQDARQRELQRAVARKIAADRAAAEWLRECPVPLTDHGADRRRLVRITHQLGFVMGLIGRHD